MIGQPYNANLIGHLDALVTLVALKNVHLCNNGTLDIWGLSTLMALETLNVRGNCIVDVSALDGLPNLTTLNLSDNWLTGALYWTDLPSLEKLYLEYNDLADLWLLAALPNLTWIDAAHNEIHMSHGERAEKELVALRRQASKLLDLRLAEEIDATAFKTKHAELQRRIDTLRGQTETEENLRKTIAAPIMVKRRQTRLNFRNPYARNGLQQTFRESGDCSIVCV